MIYDIAAYLVMKDRCVLKMIFSASNMKMATAAQRLEIVHSILKLRQNDFFLKSVVGYLGYCGKWILFDNLMSDLFPHHCRIWHIITDVRMHR